MFRKSYTVCSQSNLLWPHYKYLLSIMNEKERNYYINRCIQNNLYVRGLINQIKHEDVAQTKVYMMLTGKLLKRRFYNETIGIIITDK